MVIMPQSWIGEGESLKTTPAGGLTQHLETGMAASWSSTWQ